MNIGFFSEAGYEGKVPTNHPNMRTDVARVCALDAIHHPILTNDNLSDSLLKGELQPGDTAVIDVEDGKILITPKSSLPIASA